MTHEDNFISELRMFYDNDETIINDVSEKRIRFLLSEYKKTIKIPKNIIEPVKLIKTSYTPQKYRLINMVGTVEENLNRIAKDMCKIYNITFQQFLDSSGRGKGIVREARTEFCHTALSELPINQQVLKQYLDVNHTTIIFYLKGKKYIRKAAPIAV